MNIKRFTATLLMSAVTVSILGGCGSSGQKASSSTSNSSSTQVVDSSESKAVAANQDLPLTEAVLPIVDEPLTLTYAGMDNWYTQASYTTLLPVWEEYENRTGIKIEFEVTSDHEAYNTTMMTRIAAGQTLPDIMAVPPLWNGDVVKFAEDEVILPLTDLIYDYAPDIVNLFEEHPEVKSLLTAPDGEIYHVAELFLGGNLTNPRSMMIRQDWLDNLGLDEPETLDDWYNVLKAFKEEDPNGTGKADTIPLTSINGIGYYSFFGSAFGLPVPVEDFIEIDGEIKFARTTDAWFEMLTFLNKLYSEGLMDPDFEIDTDKLNTKMGQDSIGVVANFIGNTPAYTNVLTDNGIDGEYVVVAAPKGLDGSDPVYQGRTPLGMEFALSKDCKDPVAAIQWINYVWANPEGVRVQNFGIEGLSYEVVDGQVQYTDFVLNNPAGLTSGQAVRSLGGSPALFDNQTYEKAEVSGIEPGLEKIDSYLIGPVAFGLPTSEESARTASIMADLQTYIDEMTEKFILGTEPLSNWDTYVANVEAMGIREVEAIMQARYDRANQ